MRSALLTISFLLFCSPFICAEVEVKAGVEGLTLPVRIDSSGIGKMLPEQSAATTMPEPAEKSVSANPPITDLSRHEHLQKAADNYSPSGLPKASLPKVVGESVALGQKGVGKSDYEAFSDGNVDLRAFLPTYRPARIVAHLIDEDGEEIFFRGKSLLIWERPDDKAFAPLYFMGKVDESSMKKVSDDNFDAVSNKYSFEIKQGQKLRLEISGKPEAESNIEASGPLQ